MPNTPNLDLVQPAINPTYDLWGQDMNDNLAKIDAASILLRGTPVSATAPVLNQVLKFDGTSWAPAADVSGVSGSGTTGKLPKWTAGTALGDSILSDDGVTLTVSGNLNIVSGAILIGNVPLALANLSDGAQVMLKDGSRAMTGNLDAGANRLTNLGAPSAASDAATKGYVDGLTPPAPADASDTVKGITKLSVAPVLASNPIACGDNDSRLSDARTPLAHGLTGASHTAGTLVGLNALLDVAVVATTDSRLSDARTPTGSAGGDVTGTFPSSLVVSALQGTAISATVPTSGQVLLFTTSWAPATLSSASLSDGGSLIKTSTVLGGDLSGSLPNPTVAKVNGITVTGTPTSGQVLTATSGTAANWQTPSGGSGGGYATVVVSAPTGVAATDTSNIQTAINSIGSGTVILREGTYVVNATITMKSNVTLRGQGMGDAGVGSATALQCSASMGTISLFDISNTIHDIAFEDMTIDFNGFNRSGSFSGFDLRCLSTRSRFSRINFSNTFSNNIPIFLQPSDTTNQDRVVVDGCFFLQGKLATNGVAQIAGMVRGCTFRGITAPSGLQGKLVQFIAPSTVVGCVFRTNQDYTTGVTGATVIIDDTPSNGISGCTVSACMFIQESGTATRALQITAGGGGPITVHGCIVTQGGTNAGSMSVRFPAGTNNTALVGNVGFNGYSGAAQMVGNV